MAVIEGCEAEERAFIATTGSRSSWGVEPASRTLDVVNSSHDPAVLSSQGVPASHGAFEGPCEAPAASHQSADRPSNSVEADRGDPEEVGHETDGGPQVDATDQAPEHVDETPPAQQPQAGRTEDAQPSYQVENDSVSDFSAPEIQVARPAGEQDHEDLSGAYFSEAGASASARESEASSAEPMHIAKQHSGQLSCAPNIGAATAVLVDLGLPVPTEASEPFALPPSQGEDANGESRARMPDPSQGRVDNIEASSEPARQADHIGGPIGIARAGQVKQGRADKNKAAADVIKVHSKSTAEKYKPDLTYKGLLDFCKGKLNYARNCAAIRGLMKHHHRGLADDAVADIQSVVIVNAFLDTVGRNPNRIGALSYLRVIVTDPAKRGFKEAVRWSVVLEAETGGSIQSLATRVGLGVHTLWKYANRDNGPSAGNREALEKLEKISKYSPGTLTQHIPNWKSHYFVASAQYFNLENPLYLFLNKGASVSPLPPNLVKQIQAFFEYKSCADDCPSFLLPDGSRKELHQETAWTTNRRPARMPAEFEKWNSFPSAPIALAAIAKFCSFVNPVTGTSTDSLAFAFDPKLVERVLRRDMKVAKGYNNGHQNLVALVAQLIHPQNGFLAQLPEVFLPEVGRLGIDMGGLPWEDFVAMRHSEIKKLPHKLVPEKSRKARARRSRDKKKKLTMLLRHADSYGEVIFPTLQRLRDERPPSHAPEGVKLDFEIKYLTLTLFSACPLRLLNWAFAKWGTNLRKRDGKWWVYIPLDELKNRRFLKEDYEFLLPDYASVAVDDYFENVRARMAARNPDAEELVLAGPFLYRGRARRKDRNGQDASPAGDRVYRNIAHRMKKLTKELWNVPVTPHDWRDIYATDYLNKFPGEVLTVAAVLNDSIQTVLREYAQPDTVRLSRHAAMALDAAWLLAKSRKK